MKKIVQHGIRIFGHEISRFVIVGGSNTVFTFLLYAFFIKVFLWNYFISLTTVAFLGILYTYMLNRIWTFQSKGRFWYEMFKYIQNYAFIYAANLLLLSIMVDTYQADEVLAQIFCLIVLVPINFFFNKRFVFSKKEN